MGACLPALAWAAISAGAARAQDTLPDTHNIPTNADSSNVTFLDNTRGVSPGYSALNFIHYDQYGDFMFGNGTGGLSVWSLADPAHPAYVANITAHDLRIDGDTRDRFWEGENMTVDPKRKLVFLSRDPRGFGGQLATGTSGVYIIDVKDPYHPRTVIFHPLPAGHTSTCINDCQYLWTVGPYATGTPGNDPDCCPDPNKYLYKYGGVPLWVTDVSDPEHPFTYDKPLDLNRFDGKSAYDHSVDVDRNGVAWVAGEGGDRGYWTSGNHWDPVQRRNRIATAYDPVPYAGGTTPLTNPTQDDFFGYFDHNAQHITQKVGSYDAGELLYVTNENITDCQHAGELKIVSLKGSYNGEGWRSTPENPFRLQLVGHWTVNGKPGEADSNNCSAHWFTVNGNTIAQAWYSEGTRIIDASDPANPTQVGYFRIPSGTPGVTAGSASATYWHNGLIYVADYSRGVDVLRFDGQITGTPEGICWNSCDKATVSVPETPAGDVGGTVPATLSLTLGTAASFGPFTPGIDKDYTSSSTANVISTAGDATLSVSDPDTAHPGHLTNGTFALPSALQARGRNAANPATSFADVGSSSSPTGLLTYNGPISNDAVTLDFQQHIGASDPLRTGTYSKTLTFTLSTTNP